MKTSELTGAELDLAVAKCEYGSDVAYIYAHTSTRNAYSTDWSQAGPIIEREKITVGQYGDDWYALSSASIDIYYGPTPIIAAMRCYVASRLGDEVEVQNETI
jgi:hypothetical protein